ncbi:hypothetical protein [Paraburkholderia sp. RL17-347-BIC-D]|uniref:hypothetical protein n=1 Tax=Paraburkholderia sp. RL17-347-BIC-D TaxID=3031632 RepID=UPI0038B754C1
MTTQTNAGTQNDADELSRPNLELLAAIAEHRATSAGHIAYVIPMSELWEDAVDSDEKCIVIPLPGISASEIDYKDERLYAEVRYRPDGTALECVMMGRERIALSGVAVHLTAAEHHGRLYVLWSFDDMWAFSDYRFNGELAEDMWVASRVAESHSTPGSPRLQLVDSRRVIDISEHIVVEIPANS